MDADSVVQLEPGVNGFLDVAKTREVTMHPKILTLTLPLPLTPPPTPNPDPNPQP